MTKKTTKITKTILYNIGTPEVITTHDFNLYYRSIVITALGIGKIKDKTTNVI